MKKFILNIVHKDGTTEPIFINGKRPEPKSTQGEAQALADEAVKTLPPYAAGIQIIPITVPDPQTETPEDETGN